MTNNAGQVTTCADGRTLQIAAVTKGFPKVSKLWRWEGDIIRSYVMVIFKYGIVFGVLGSQCCTRPRCWTVMY